MRNTLPISVIIPALNASETIGHAISSVKDYVSEVIVVDGGSSDDTIRKAAEGGAIITDTLAGRGSQLKHGASKAKSRYLLFLHADTRLREGWAEEVAVFCKNKGEAGAFRFELDYSGYKARALEKFVALRCRYLGWAWGDQGLLISRQLYESIGGFRGDLVLFEDTEIIRRIGKKRLHIFDAGAVTSAQKYVRDGFIVRCTLNFLCLSAYLLGISPKGIKRFYGK